MMKGLYSKAQNKLKSKAGFSLTELLVATVILGIMTVGLATGVAASLQTYNESVTYSEERVLLSTLSDAVISELRFAKDIKDVNGQYVWNPAVGQTDKQEISTYTSEKYGIDTKFNTTTDEDAYGTITMNNGTKDPILLVGKGAYHQNDDKLVLSARMDPVKFTKDANGNINLSTTIYVKPTGSDKDPQTREISVRPIDQLGAN